MEAPLMIQASAEDIGIERLLDRFVRVGQYDHVIVVYSPDSRLHAAKVGVHLSTRHVVWSSVPMVPMVDEGFRARLYEAMPDPATVLGNLVIITLERDSMSHFDVLAPVFDRYGQARTRIVRIISATKEFFESALSLSPEELEQRNATLLSKLQGVTDIRVTTARGTDLDIKLDQEKYDWISNRGKLRAGAFTILPPGEIATYPAVVNGRLIADGAVNCNVFSDLDMRLGAAPITIDIEDSRIVDWHCSGSSLRAFLEQAFQSPNATNIGELGFGTNTGLGEFLAHNSHLNERHPGLHLGFGQHNQPLSVVPYEATLHIDVVTDGATIRLPNGTDVDLLTFENDPAAIHPTLIRDEDVTGDCCSSGCRVVVI